MSKYAAKISIGWMNQCYEGDSPCAIIEKAEEVQDFGCLLRMGSIEGTKKDQKELKKLEEFLHRYYDQSLTMEDIRNLNIKLSIGSIVCHGIAETEEEIEKLKSAK